jgi:hypothetical protein
MIHHISIAVDNPLHVAEILSQVWKGKLFPFPPHPGSYMVLAQDEYGTAIELYPMGTNLIPGELAGEFAKSNQVSQFVPFHAAISIPASLEEMQEIGMREGWLVKKCDRGPFHVVEFWIENKLMLEFLTPEFAREYLEFAQPQNYEAFFAAAVG